MTRLGAINLNSMTSFANFVRNLRRRTFVLNDKVEQKFVPRGHEHSFAYKIGMGIWDSTLLVYIYMVSNLSYKTI